MSYSFTRLPTAVGGLPAGATPVVVERFLADEAAINTLQAAVETVGDATLALASGVFLPEDYGAAGDGVTDDSAAFAATLAAWYAAGGGTVLLAAKTYRLNSALTIPNGGTPNYYQPPLAIIGAGAWIRTGVPVGGTILEMRATAAPAKFDTRGQGRLVIEGITFSDQGHNTRAFIQTTMTTVHIHRCMFYGWAGQSGTACDQDAIVLGGPNDGANDGSADAPYQGYGSTITECQFNHVRRAVYFRTYCNGAVFARNTIWQQAGSNLAGGAAIDILGHTTNSCLGVVVRDNYLEGLYYPYQVRMEHAIGCVVDANSVNDTSATYLALVRLESTAQYNYINATTTQGKPAVSEATAGVNMVISVDPNGTTVYPGVVRFRDQLQLLNGSYIGPRIVNDGAGGGAANDQMYFQVYSWGGSGTKFQFTYDPAAAADEAIGAFVRQSATETRLELYGSAIGRVLATAVLVLEHAGGSYLQLGPNSGPSVRIGVGTQIKGHLSTIVAWNPGLIAGGARATKAVTVTGAAVGDEALGAFGAVLPAGCQIFYEVTAANTVTATIWNTTAGNLTPSSSTVRASVWQH